MLFSSSHHHQQVDDEGSFAVGGGTGGNNEDILPHLLEYLSYKDIIPLRLVSKTWKDIVQTLSLKDQQIHPKSFKSIKGLHRCLRSINSIKLDQTFDINFDDREFVRDPNYPNWIMSFPNLQHFSSLHTPIRNSIFDFSASVTRFFKLEFFVTVVKLTW